MSTLRVNAIQNTSGVEQYLAKAWVNFNGTGTVAIRASGNVSSITDNGTGDYTVNFTSAMADANYALTGTATLQTTFALPRLLAASGSADFGTTSVRIRTSNDAGVYEDCAVCNVVIFR